MFTTLTGVLLLWDRISLGYIPGVFLILTRLCVNLLKTFLVLGRRLPDATLCCCQPSACSRFPARARVCIQTKAPTRLHVSVCKRAKVEIVVRWEKQHMLYPVGARPAYVAIYVLTVLHECSTITDKLAESCSRATEASAGTSRDWLHGFRERTCLNSKAQPQSSVMWVKRRRTPARRGRRSKGRNGWETESLAVPLGRRSKVTPGREDERKGWQAFSAQRKVE